MSMLKIAPAGGAYLTDRAKPLLDRLAALAAETRRQVLAGMPPDE